MLTLFGNPLGHDPFHCEARSVRIAAGGERFVFGAQEARLGKTSLGLRQHDVGRNQAFVAGVSAEESGDNAAGTGIDQRAAGRVPGLGHVGRRLMAVLPMCHAANDRVLVRQLGQLRQQLTDVRAGHVGRGRFVERSAVVVTRLRLGIERVVVRRATPHPDLDHRLGGSIGGGGCGLRRASGAAGEPESGGTGQARAATTNGD